MISRPLSCPSHTSPGHRVLRWCDRRTRNTVGTGLPGLFCQTSPALIAFLVRACGPRLAFFGSTCNASALPVLLKHSLPSEGPRGARLTSVWYLICAICITHALCVRPKSTLSPLRRTRCPMAYWDAYNSDSDSDTASDSSSTSSVEDEDEVNARCTPNWDFHRSTLLRHGFHLDTVKDVKQFYERYWRSSGLNKQPVAEYSRACSSDDEDALCKDPGLVSASSGLLFINVFMWCAPSA